MLKVIIILLLSISLTHSQELQIDKIATESIKKNTTEERFLTDWVSSLPEHPTVPSPRDILGYTIGTEGKLTHPKEIYTYFNALAAASKNVKIINIGKSFEGRDMIIVAIADENTLKRLDEYKKYNQQLSDPRITSTKQAEEIIKLNKPIYWMTAGLHSTELGPPEMVMELAYRLAVEEKEVFKQIRNNVITFITPVLEIDGRTRAVEWYYRHSHQYKRRKDTPPKTPFWGHYSFHDNNRDGIVMTQPLTQNYVKAFFEWKPVLSLDLHESVPLLYVATGTGPYNEGVDPITITEWQTIANYEITRLTAKGLPGVWTWGFYTGWFPGYLLWVTNNHNSNGRFYETFGNGTTYTVERDLSTARYAGEKITDKTWYRSIPPDKKLMWSMRNNTNFMENGVIASLELVAKNPKMFMENFYQKNVNAMSRAVKDAPYAYRIKSKQKDLNAAKDLVTILNKHGIEMSIAQTSLKEKKKELVSKGDIIIKLNQPYGPLAKNLMGIQKFPENAKVPPYDDVAWTLSYQFGVDVDAIKDKKVLDLKSTLTKGEGYFTSKAPSKKYSHWIINNTGQNELGPFRIAASKSDAVAIENKITVNRKNFNPGSIILTVTEENYQSLKSELESRQLEATGFSYKQSSKIITHELDVPKIAMYQTWISTQNSGWARFSLDEAKVPYTLITKDEVKEGSLKQKFDVILVPSLWGSTKFKDIISGVDKKWSPLAYTKTDSTPSHGSILSSEDITGGLGFDGMYEIQKFVEDGGTLITLHSGGVLAAESGIQKDISIYRPSGLNSPGSILTSMITQKHPLTYGYEKYNHIFKTNGPLFGVSNDNRHLSVMQIGTKEIPAKEESDKKNDTKTEKKPALVLSGAILRGKQSLDGAPALLHKKVGNGSIVIFTWNPLHRHINHHDHGYLYNAILNWNDLYENEKMK